MKFKRGILEIDFSDLKYFLNLREKGFYGVNFSNGERITISASEVYPLFIELWKKNKKKRLKYM